ncbi:MAG: secretin N-terminal domain-containing protein [Betaproteobacteria bacterium]|nr:secretin N-terminal domain-containing protein [Betaproteobacteria bacterium]
MLPADVVAAVISLLALSVGGCATYQPTVPPSKGHINADQFPAKAADEKILPPVTTSNFVPLPKPQVKAPTYSVVVNEVPVKELLFALSRDTRQNIDVHPSIQGLVSLNAIDETLPAILERVAQQVNIRYRTEGKTILVLPDSPYFRTYKVNYVNMSRDTASSIGVSGEISGSTVGGGGQSGGAQGQVAGGTSNTKVDTKSVNNFWDVLRQNIEAILSASKAISQSADQRAARAESERAAKEERIAQAEAVSRAGGNAASLFTTAFGTGSIAPTDTKNEIVVNAVTGTVSVLGTEKQQVLIQQYLDSVGSASQRQVLIEATIVEVKLSNNYQAGVDWSRLAASIGNGASFTQQLIGAPPTGAPNGLTIGYTNPNSRVGDVSATIRLLEQFGNTRVLSSPKLMALNNQTALLKVVDNVVYFNIEAQTNTNQTTSTTTFTTTAKTVPVGLVMSVLPQVTDSGTVNLTVRPTISRISGTVQDPNPSLRAQFTATGVQTSPAIPNLIPQVQVREMESVLQAGSGQTIILGGLMQDDVRRDRDAVPGLGRLPSPASDVFSFRDEAVSKTELVIFLKPTVISNPSLDSDELKFFRRFLPTIDPSGKTP